MGSGGDSPAMLPLCLSAKVIVMKVENQNKENKYAFTHPGKKQQGTEQQRSKHILSPCFSDFGGFIDQCYVLPSSFSSVLASFRSVSRNPVILEERISLEELFPPPHQIRLWVSPWCLFLIDD